MAARAAGFNLVLQQCIVAVFVVVITKLCPLGVQGFRCQPNVARLLRPGHGATAGATAETR